VDSFQFMAVSSKEGRQRIGLILNPFFQMIVWFELMGVMFFGAAGTTNHAAGWLYLGEMIAISAVFWALGPRIDPRLLRERLKPPVQKDAHLVRPAMDKVLGLMKSQLRATTISRDATCPSRLQNSR
jgi:hypothetical protein